MSVKKGPDLMLLPLTRPLSVLIRGTILVPAFYLRPGAERCGSGKNSCSIRGRKRERAREEKRVRRVESAGSVTEDICVRCELLHV